MSKNSPSRLHLRGQMNGSFERSRPERSIVVAPVVEALPNITAEEKDARCLASAGDLVDLLDMTKAQVRGQIQANVHPVATYGLRHLYDLDDVIAWLKDPMKPNGRRRQQ